MEIFSTDIKLYVTRSGKTPFLEWLERLRDEAARAKIRVRLDRVRLGLLGDYKSVGQGVCELRIPFGSGFRVYFGQEGSRIVILLLGGDKRTQNKDIQTAIKYWKDYGSRKDED